MSALSQGISRTDHFNSNRKAVIDRMERKATNTLDLLKQLAKQRCEGSNLSMKWNDLTVHMRCRMHALSGDAKIYARKTGDYQTEYFVQISDEGLSKVLFNEL